MNSTSAINHPLKPLQTKNELMKELEFFVNSVGNKDNWVGDRLNVWFAKRHCRQWAEELKQKFEVLRRIENVDIIP